MTIALGVLVSGSGSNLQGHTRQGGRTAASTPTSASSSPTSLTRWGLSARGRRVSQPPACATMSFPERTAFDGELVRLLREAGVELVALAGFMRILTPAFLTPFAGRVVNIHPPALLPACPGLRAQGQQADHGVRLAGCTVHFVDEQMDHGPVIIQAAVPAYPDDDEATLGARHIGDGTSYLSPGPALDRPGAGACRGAAGRGPGRIQDHGHTVGQSAFGTAFLILEGGKHEHIRTDFDRRGEALLQGPRGPGSSGIISVWLPGRSPLLSPGP